MRHVILGGNGFTGQYLVKTLLDAGNSVLVVDLGDVPVNADADYHRADIRNAESLHNIQLGEEDIVYHLAARQYGEKIPYNGREEQFSGVNVVGTSNVLTWINASACRRLIYFSTDMVYGLPDKTPVATTHPRRPLGPYGLSKSRSEQLCEDCRGRGMNITIFRPRLIVGPGRFGVLEKLFELIRRGLPVPLIGNGSNRYQMVSVIDCVQAIMCAVSRNIPNGVYNLGSESPPTVKVLLKELIKRVGSKSFLVPTPAAPVQLVLGCLDRLGATLLYPEQYMLANAEFLVDISTTKSDLGWQPQERDGEMIFQAYQAYISERLRD